MNKLDKNKTHKENLGIFFNEALSAVEYWKKYMFSLKFYKALFTKQKEDFVNMFPEGGGKMVRYSFVITITFAIPTIMLLTYSRINGQAPVQIVNDPAANANLAQNVAQTTTIATNMKATLEVLKKTNDALSKVSSAVTNLETLERVTKDQQQMIKMTQDSYNAMKKSKKFSPRELGDMMINFNRVLDNTLRTMEIVTQLLRNDHLKMNDAERYKMLLEMEQTINSQRRELQGIASNYYTLRNKRTLRTLFKSTIN